MKLNLTPKSAIINEQQNASETASKRRLLIVDDEQMLLVVLSDIFQAHYDLKTAESGEAALHLLAEGFRPEVIIADQRMTGMSGAQFLAESIKYTPNAVRVILTGYTDVQDIIDSINLGNVYRFLTKPWQREELVEAVRLCFEHYDVTTRNSELAEALQKLRELSNEKDEMLGLVAHDLKNPLQVIREYAEMCNEDDEMPLEMRKNMLKTIVRTSNRMFGIIKNLLDVNALERGTINLSPIPLPIGAIVGFVVNDYRSRAEAKNITLHFAPTPDLKAFADESMTIQVMDNLISNAVKYSPHGKNVYVRIKEKGFLSEALRGQKEEEGELSEPSSLIRIEVQDEGQGISAKDMEKLFGKFARLTARPTGNEDSTGLGLSIVKKIVEAMNGKVWCESEGGNGATFIVELPKAA